MTFVKAEHLLQAFQGGVVEFDKVVINRAHLSSSFLPFVSLAEAHLQQADFCHAVLPGSNLHRAYLVGTNFEHANLLGANLSSANLNQANLDHALIASGNLARTILRGASLVGASLANADLSFSDLRNANLIGASLQNTDLSEANLLGARISPNTLDNAILKSTIMPDGYCYSGDWKNYKAKPSSAHASNAIDIAWSNEEGSEKTNSASSLPRRRTQSVKASRQLSSSMRSTDSSASPQKIISFRVHESHADLILEILDNFTPQDKNGIICINHLF
jgi:uncharacterized protein YjbI with pentapeptide repeats